MHRLTLSILVLAATTSVARADDGKQVRVIPITKDSAAESAKIISASRSPLIGMPPPGRTIRAASDWRNARAELPAGKAKVAARGGRERIMRLEVSEASPQAESLPEDPRRARVQIVKPGKGEAVVETYLVPKE
jgi:hypothetical protein